MQNATGEQMEFTAKTPFSAAQMLRHLVRNDGQGVFDREHPMGTTSVFIGMEKRARLDPDNKEYCLPAFNIEYRSFDETGRMMIQHPEVRSYQWMGDVRVMDRDPMLCEAPRINDLINVFERAGKDWRNVNFMNMAGRPVMRLAVDNDNIAQLG